MRGVIEQIVAHPQGVDGATLAEVRRYTSVLATQRPLQQPDGPQVRLDVHAAGACRGRQAAASNGATFALTPGGVARCHAGTAANRCSSTRRSMRASPTRIRCRQRHFARQRQHLYMGVGLADLKGFNEKYGSTRPGQTNGKLVEEVYRIDGSTAPTSPRSSSTSKRRFLCRAADREGATALAKFYRSGEVADREAYDIAWVEGQGVAGRHDQRVHRGLSRSARHQGRWEALVFYGTRRKPAASRRWRPTRSGRGSQPWDAKYRKPA